MPTVYDVITGKVIEKLEAGTVPWHKPWNAETGAPRNLTSGRPYRGINIFLLGCQSDASPFWGTYKQITELGGHVRKRERGSPVVFWKWLDGKDEGARTARCRFAGTTRYSTWTRAKAWSTSASTRWPSRRRRRLP